MTTEYLIPETCCICGGDIEVHGTWTKGHNAQPAADGRCCDACNWDVVMPMRMEAIARRMIRREQEQ